MMTRATVNPVTLALWDQAGVYVAFALGMIAWYRWKGWMGVRMKAGPFDRSKAVSMPADHIQPPDRKLKNFRNGDTAYVWFSDVVVTESGATFVDLDARILEEPGSLGVQVRLVEGGCILILPEAKEPRKFLRRRLYSTSNYIPVLRIEKEEMEPANSEPDPVGSSPTLDEKNSPAVAASGAPAKEETLEDIKAELQNLVGLSAVKKQFLSLSNLLRTRQLRINAGLAVNPTSHIAPPCIYRQSGHRENHRCQTPGASLSRARCSPQGASG